MHSIWSESSPRPVFPALNRDIQTDVLVIGGGITGLLCAYMLTQAGIDCVLTEAANICGGITADTTAKITLQHGLCYHKLLERFGVERSRMYLQANRDALKLLRCLAQGIPCDLETKSSFVYSLDDERLLHKELEALEQLCYPADYVRSLPLPFSTAGAVRFKNQAQFHPLRFLYGIAGDLKIYENTMVHRLDGTTAVTDGGSIRASRVIVATHFPFLNRHGLYFLKMYQQRSYVLALENAQSVDGMYRDACDKGLSFRTYGSALLLGGGGHRTGKLGGGWDTLSDFAREYYPEATVTHRWATQDCMTLDGVPYIGPYSSSLPDIFVATGFNKWGMTSAMAAAMILRDLVQGRDNPYAPVFSPSRNMLRPQLLVNAGHAAGNLLSLSPRRCPHMGCALKWNPQEHTWDCPCHGSRFTESGKLISGPATGDWKPPK